MNAALSRRRFLQAAGGCVLGMPLLQSLMGRGVRGDAGTFPKRLIIFYTPNGVNPDVWFPTPGPSGLDTDFTLVGATTPLAPFKSKLIFTSGINMESLQPGPGEPHQRGMGAVLCGDHLQEGNFVGGDGSLAGWGNGRSIDQYLAPIIKAPGQLQSLELGVRAIGAEVRTRINYLGPAQPVPPENDPRAAFHRLFDGYNVPPNDAERLRQSRHTVLTAVNRNFVQLRGQVSTEDRVKLDQHRAFVRDLDVRLSSMGTAAPMCTIPAEPPLFSDATAEGVMDQVDTLQIDVAVAALACDRTRVVTIQNSTSANNIRFPWLMSYADDHSLSHAGPSDVTSQQEWAGRKHWYAQQFAYLLTRLSAIQEGASTLLDNCVILWCSELAQGNTHSHDNMPFLLAGSGGGYFRTGRYVQFQGKSHNDLLVSILNAMGQPDTTYGDPVYCSGPLPGLT